MWRRIQYATGFFAVCGMFSVLIYYTNFYQPPTCTDSLQNGEEKGVDCGGGCVQICPADVSLPQLRWAKSFEVNEGQYNVVAYIDNKNQTAGTPELRYTIKLYSGDEVVKEITGQAILPPNSIYPIFEGRVFVDKDKPVTSTSVVLEPVELWLPASAERDQFNTTDINLTGADSKPQLRVEIENTTLTDARDIVVVATIFNDDGEAVTASQTSVEYLAALASKDIIFTWPKPIAKTVRSCSIPTDVALVIDLSGSMNNDGSNPPQPITKVLDSASTFASSLNANDQVSLITFASRAKLVTPMTKAQESVGKDILGLKIDPLEETGFTNTVEALTTAEAELNSERHNKDARRVLVLLTDGLPTAPKNEDIVVKAEEVAKQLDESGIEVYAIGLGEKLDQQFIRDIASNVNNAYFSPTGEDLAKIYSEITSSLCEFGPTKIEIITKTKTSFAPIQ